MSFYRHHNTDTFLSLIMSLLFVTVIISSIQDAFTYLGFSFWYVILLLWASFFASFINIPITTIESRDYEYVTIPISFFGFKYVMPVMRRPRKTLVAINLGGAIIPILISLVLLAQSFKALLLSIPTIILAALIIHRFAKIIPGIGIAVPFFIPPLVSAVLALLISFNDESVAPIIAYSTGVFGSLLGADLMNLRRIHEMDAPIASIGGAGTFDGVFLAGVFAVLLIGIV